MLWIQVILHGFPAAIAVLVIAPANLRHGKDPTQTVIAVVISIFAVVGTLLRVAGMF